MSLRLLTHRLLGHGRAIVFNYCRRNIHHINILERRGGAAQSRRAAAHLPKAGQQQLTSSSSSAKNSSAAADVSVAGRLTSPTSGLFRFGQHARRLFVDNILNRVSPSPHASGLRADATRKLLYGDSAPFLSLIGVSLATGSILTKDDELEAVCWEIREAVSRLQCNWGRENVSQTMTDSFGLANLDIGPPIAKGCAAVVYSAAIKSPAASAVANVVDATATATATATAAQPPAMSPIQNTSRFVHNFGGSADNLHHQRRSFIADEYQRRQSISIAMSTLPAKMSAQKRLRYDSIDESHNDGHPGADGAANMQTLTAANADNNANKSTSIPPPASPTNAPSADDTTSDLVRYPFALKMMFNYDIQSNALAILRAMYKETIPARAKHTNTGADAWEQILRQQTVTLPPHPNIVLMFGVFCDQIPNLAAGASLYPMALPPRINPNGYGRNMSLFLLMKRYNHRLCEYLTANADRLGWRTRLLIFAQLLEGCAHLQRYGVAHRDLKSDNILVDLNDDIHPVVVLSDFGCCLADRRHGLQLPYTSADVDKGGNAALMAPEIIAQLPGTFSVLDYGKSDLWACGALAYEIFGRPNPFYAQQQPQGAAADGDRDGGGGLRNSSYTDEQLPRLPAAVPSIVRHLVENILQRNPRHRVRADVAANVMQLYLWAPSAWLRAAGNPSSSEILQWMLSLTTKVLCENRKGNGKSGDDAEQCGGAPDSDAFGYRMGRRTYTEYLLISSFLVRARLESVRTAISWIQNIVSAEEEEAVC